MSVTARCVVVCCWVVFQVEVWTTLECVAEQSVGKHHRPCDDQDALRMRTGFRGVSCRVSCCVFVFLEAELLTRANATTHSTTRDECCVAHTRTRCCADTTRPLAAPASRLITESTALAVTPRVPQPHAPTTITQGGCVPPPALLPLRTLCLLATVCGRCWLLGCAGAGCGPPPVVRHCASLSGSSSQSISCCRRPESFKYR